MHLLLLLRLAFSQRHMTRLLQKQSNIPTFLH